MVQAFPSSVHATMTSRPGTGLGHLRAWAAQKRWPLAATLRAAADRRPYGRWLHHMAADLSPPLMMDRVPQLSWQVRVGLPPWASSQAVAAVRAALRQAAGAVKPLAATRAQHEVLLAIHSAARMCRALTRWSAQAGLPVHYPFLDDRVIEPATYVEASTARQAVVAVSVRCAGHGCLPRSIATALLCPAHGIWPTWHTGVRTQPFAAHAWVEAEGRPVNEPHITAQMRPLITIAPLLPNLRPAQEKHPNQPQRPRSRR